MADGGRAAAAEDLRQNAGPTPSAGSAPPRFIPAGYGVGPSGYVFKNGNQGMGYYLEDAAAAAAGVTSGEMGHGTYTKIKCKIK